jgi:hypothetical protein
MVFTGDGNYVRYSDHREQVKRLERKASRLSLAIQAKWKFQDIINENKSLKIQLAIYADIIAKAGLASIDREHNMCCDADCERMQLREENEKLKSLLASIDAILKVCFSPIPKITQHTKNRNG